MSNDVFFSQYSLFTTVLLISSFLLLFVIITSFGNTSAKVPIGIVYISMAIVGLRLFVPIEFDALSIEINSKVIMSAINNFWKYKIFEFNFGTLTVSKLLYIIWGAVAAILLFVYITKQILFRYNLSLIPEIHDQRICNQLDLIYSKHKFNFNPKVIKNSFSNSPAETGYFKQTIIISGDSYIDEEMYYILLHEMAHYHLKNNIANLCIELLRIVFWWNPVIHLFEHHFKNLMETYADRLVVNALDSTQRLNYLECLLRVYKTSDTATSELNAFVNPIAGNFSKHFLKKRFVEITKDEKINIPMSISMIAMSIICCMLTVFIVFQPSYDTTDNDMPYTDITIDETNSYIVKEGTRYALYYKGEPILYSSNIEDLELYFNKEE